MFSLNQKINGKINLGNKQVSFSGVITDLRSHSYSCNESVITITFARPVAFWGEKDIRTSISKRFNSKGECWDRENLHAVIG